MKFPLIIPPGLNADDTTFAAKGAWADCDKVRFIRGFPQVIGGWQSLSVGLLGGVCRGALAWADLNSIINIAFGTHLTLEVVKNDQLYNITPVGLPAGLIDSSGGAGYGAGLYGEGDYSEPTVAGNLPRTWSLSTYGQTLIANPRGQTIYQWTNNELSPAVAVTNAPATVTYALVTPTRQLMAFGCNEEVSGNFNPLAIRFTDIEDITDWTTTATNNAGEVILEGGGNRIVGARLSGAYVLVWTDTALFLGTFQGTAGWRFDRVGDKCGLIGPNAAVVVGQIAYWLGINGLFFGYALGSEAKPISSPVTRSVSDNLVTVQRDKVYASTISEFGEVRFDYPDARDGIENSRYVSMSTMGDGWSKGIQARTAFMDAGATENPVGVDAAGNIFYHERGQTADGGPFSWSIESADQYLGEGDQVLAVSGVWPDFKDQVGAANLEFLFRMYPQGPQRTKGPYAMSPGRSRRDFRSQGRVVKIRISGNSSPTYLRFGKMEFEVEGAGYR